MIFLMQKTIICLLPIWYGLVGLAFIDLLQVIVCTVCVCQNDGECMREVAVLIFAESADIE